MKEQGKIVVKTGERKTSISREDARKSAESIVDQQNKGEMKRPLKITKERLKDIKVIPDTEESCTCKVIFDTGVSNYDYDIPSFGEMKGLCELFTEAGNTYRETGLTPSQQQERIKELEKVLKELLSEIKLPAMVTTDNNGIMITKPSKKSINNADKALGNK